MSDTDALTLATQAVRRTLPLRASAEEIARAALDAVGALAPGAQPNPAPGDGRSCHDLAIERLTEQWGPGSARDRLAADLATRRDFGLRKYGTSLQPHNGRSASLDAYGEVLDLIAYLTQLDEEEGEPGLDPHTVGLLLDDTIDTALRLVAAQRFRVAS